LSPAVVTFVVTTPKRLALISIGYVATVRKKPRSRFWYACFTEANGRRRQRSTKEIDRKKAQRLADHFEEAAQRRLTARQAQRVVTEIYCRATGNSLLETTTRDYFERWLDRKKAEISPASHEFYGGKARRFLEWLDARAADTLLNLTRADILAFRSAEHQRVRPATVNHALKFLRGVFEDAKREGAIADNPTDGVKLVKADQVRSRRPFSITEISQLLAIANPEWQSLIHLGLYTGQRFGDLARLTWGKVDLEHEQISFVTSKTGRRQIIPLAPPLRTHLREISRQTNDPGEPLHPIAFSSVTKSGRVSTLSRQFKELMAKAGIVPAKRHRALPNGSGRSGRHTVSELSFHSPRHTATSLMKIAGISSAIVQDIIGHESSAISDNYTQIDEAAKRNALSAMPNVLDHVDS
jgi:integrase